MRLGSKPANSLRGGIRGPLRFILSLFLWVAWANVPNILMAADYTIRVTFENPSEIDPMDKDNRYYLPAEVRLDDVLNKGELALEYDPARSLYYVHKQMLLQPKEKKEYKVVVHDVWAIDLSELEFLKLQTEERLAALEETDLYEKGKMLHDELLKQLAEITTSQNNSELSIAEKIELARVNREKMRMIRLRVLLLQDYKTKIQDDAEYLLEPKTIQLNITATNPSDTETKKESIRQYLPEGIGPDIIIDPQNFKIQFDPEKRLFYLANEVDLKPGETRKFSLQIQDRWRVRETKLDGYHSEAKEIAAGLAGSEFETRSKYLIGEIDKYINVIKDTQTRKVSIKDKMALFQDNTKRVEVIEKNIAELRRMLEIMRERERQNKLEEILKRVFKEAAWKIIYGTIFLLGLISFFTYILWWGQIKKKQNEKFQEVE